MGKRKQKKIRTKKDIIIPAGTILSQAPVKTARHGFHGQGVLDFGKDAVAFFMVADDVIEVAADTFEWVE